MSLVYFHIKVHWQQTCALKLESMSIILNLFNPTIIYANINNK